MAKKAMFVIFVIVILVMTMTGCAKVVSEETYEAPVRIVDTDYDPPVVRPMKSGSVIIMQTTPADYDVVVEYAGVEYNIDSRDAYNMAKDNVGSTMQATIVKTRYEDGTVTFNVTGLVESK